MKVHEDIFCTIFGLTIGGWGHSWGSGLGYTIMVATLTGFTSWFGAQFARYVWHSLRNQFKRH